MATARFGIQFFFPTLWLPEGDGRARFVELQGGLGVLIYTKCRARNSDGERWPVGNHGGFFGPRASAEVVPKPRLCPDSEISADLGGESVGEARGARAPQNPRSRSWGWREHWHRWPTRQRHKARAAWPGCRERARGASEVGPRGGADLAQDGPISFFAFPFLSSISNFNYPNQIPSFVLNSRFQI
jgi:hypothetical protein